MRAALPCPKRHAKPLRNSVWEFATSRSSRTSTTARPPWSIALLKQSGTFRENQKVDERGHGLQRPRARARHHHPRQVHLGRLEGHAHQHRRHAGPRRLRRRGRAHPLHGRRRPAAGRRRRRPDAADQVRARQGAEARPAADRGDQQGRPARRRAPTGCSTRSSTCSPPSTPATSSSTSPSSTPPAAHGWAALEPDGPTTDLAPLFELIARAMCRRRRARATARSACWRRRWRPIRSSAAS